MPQSVTHGVNLVVRDVDRSDAAAIVGILNPIRAGPGRHGWQSKGASMTGITANGARIQAAALEEEAAAPFANCRLT